LYEAVSNNNLDVVKKMIKKIDPLLVSEQNKKDNGNTPLHKAAINYSFDLLELLIEKLKTMQDFDKKYLLFKNDLGQTCLDIVFHALDQHLKRYIQEKNHSLKQVADLFLNKDQGKETLQELLQAKIENKENVSNGDSVLDLVKNSIGAKSFEFKAFLSQEQIEAIREKYTTLLNSIQSIKSGVK
jgi:ankyrin repeat protein